MNLKRTLLLSTFLFSILTLSAQTINMDALKAMKPRNIGPAGMSGRVTAIDVVHSEPDIIYAGTASGGLWKSEGGGIKWEPIFDNEKYASIGAVAIVQSSPDVVWVGTGEGNPRNSQTSGGGIYKTMDGGKSWTLMGLEKTRNIHRILIHPDDPNTILVAAMGYAWGESEDRGVFKTTDGGKTWRKVLYVSPKVGATDFIMDPSNPNKMFVNMWEFRRWPWFFKSGGPGSGLYVTLDGGETWTKRTSEDGLPEGDLGKMGLAISKSNPKVVYALIEAKKNGLYRSDDGGFKWKKTADKDIGDRPFYYADIAVDPSNENRLYNVFSNVKVSNDGGKTFETLLGWDNIHGDHHFWWIHPDDPDYMVNGNDGGLAITRDRGKTWRFIENLPVAQFYHIRADNEMPYNVLGGMQDNGSWRGPAYVWRKGGIRNGYWEEIAFGDGFDVIVDADDDTKGYGMSQGGYVQRLDFVKGTARLVRPMHPDGDFLRFNWNAAIAQDPFNKNIIYYGSQHVHKTSDEGASWEVISPDLTTNDPAKQNQVKSGGLTYDATGAENYTTIISIEPSAVQEGVIWAGTDDGNIQLTMDGGKTWENKVGRIKNFPSGAWVAQIHASRHNAGEVFVVANDYRRDNQAPYLYHSTDFGKTWTNLVSEDKVWGYTLSVIQDPTEPNLVFLGTEYGLYVSIDKGKNWTKWTNGYPTVSTMDMVIQERERDLVIGTFGRSAWIMDDIQPLREMAGEGQQLLDNAIHVYKGRDAYLVNYQQARGTRFHGDAIFKGENRKYGALINFSVKDLKDDLKADTLKVEILNEGGEVIRNLKVPATLGMNRFFWDLSRKGVRSPRVKKEAQKAEPTGPPVLPGTYTVRVHNLDQSSETQVTVHTDPRIEISESDIQATDAVIQDIIKQVELTTLGMDQLRSAKASIGDIMKKVKTGHESKMEAYKELTDGLNAQIDSLTAMVVPGPEIQGIYRNPAQLSVMLGNLQGYFNSPLSGPSSTFGTAHPVYYAPGENYKPMMKNVKEGVKEFVEKTNAFIDGPWKEFQEKVATDQIGLFPETEKIELE